MKKADKIILELMRWAKGGYDVVIPNFYLGNNECDLFRITGSDLIIEYEVKISRSDFFADFKKEQKHIELSKGSNTLSPNRFFYVVTEGLVTKDEVPKYAGLLYFNKYEGFDVIKGAPLLHKAKVSFERYRSVCRTLASRDEVFRAKVRHLRNFDAEKEISSLKRQVTKERDAYRDLQKQLFELRMENRRLKSEKAA